MRGRAALLACLVPLLGCTSSAESVHQAGASGAAGGGGQGEAAIVGLPARTQLGAAVSLHIEPRATAVWTASCGTLDTAEGASVTWTAPAA